MLPSVWTECSVCFKKESDFSFLQDSCLFSHFLGPAKLKKKIKLKRYEGFLFVNYFILIYIE